MPFVASVTGSFFSGRRATAFTSAPWDPSTDITPALWLDASDSSNYTESFNELTSITDKAGNFTVTLYDRDWETTTCD